MIEDHMGIQGATQAALTPDRKVKLIKKKLTPSEAICHNDVETEVDQTNKVAAWRKKTQGPRKVGSKGYLAQQC